MDRPGMRLLFASVLGLFALVLLPWQAQALEFDAGSSPDVPEGAVIDDDLVLMGGTVSVEGEVTRDVLVMAGTVEINGTIGGSVHVASGTVDISGDVGDSIRIAAGTVRVNGSVGWDVVVAGGSVTIEPAAEIGNDLVAGSGSLVVEGDVGRDIRGSFGSLELGGDVGGDVWVTLDDELVVRDGVTIDGDLRYRADQEADLGEGVEVGGEVIFDERERDSFASEVASWLGSVLLRLGWAIVVGTGLILLLPRQSEGIANHLRRHPIGSLLWGIAASVVIPVFALFLLLTIIGVPAGLFLIAGAAGLLYLSQVIVGLALGQALMPGSWHAEPSRWRLWIAMVVGVTIILVVRLLPIPFGWTFWTSLFVGFLAFGAVWIFLTGLGVNGRRQPVSAPSAPGD